MPIAVNPYEVSEYQLKDDPAKTIFLCIPCPDKEWSKLAEPFTDVSRENGRTNIVPLTAASVAAVKVTLKGWKHFNFPDGTPCEFKADENGLVTDECLAMVDTGSKIELAALIIQSNKLSPEEAKN